MSSPTKGYVICYDDVECPLWAIFTDRLTAEKALKELDGDDPEGIVKTFVDEDSVVQAVLGSDTGNLEFIRHLILGNFTDDEIRAQVQRRLKE